MTVNKTDTKTLTKRLERLARLRAPWEGLWGSTTAPSARRAERPNATKGYATMSKRSKTGVGRKLTLALAATAISGCAKSTAVIDTACSLFEPIKWSSRDTAETRRQVIAHNSKWECRCRKDCPK